MATGARSGEVGARIAWVDAARGIGIALMVYGHALRGQITAGFYSADAVAGWEDRLIYAFHMPLFFLISGLFATVGGSRAGFLNRRIRTLAWPYLLWSIVQGFISMLASHYANTPVRLDDLFRIGWQPIGQFWFLYALFLCNLPLLFPRPLFYASVPILLIGGYLVFGGTIVALAASNLPFFAVGVLVGAGRLSDWLGRRSIAIALLVGGWIVFAAAFTADTQAAPAVLGYLRAFAGIAGTLGLAALIAPHVGWLVRLGAATMPIYLMHVIAQAAFRTVLGPLSLPPVAMLTAVALFALTAPMQHGICYRAWVFPSVSASGRLPRDLARTRKRSISSPAV